MRRIQGRGLGTPEDSGGPGSVEGQRVEQRSLLVPVQLRAALAIAELTLRRGGHAPAFSRWYLKVLGVETGGPEGEGDGGKQGRGAGSKSSGVGGGGARPIAWTLRSSAPFC